MPLTNFTELHLRFLSPQDINLVKILGRDWFPIEYPDTWFQEITFSRWFNLGLIVA